MARKPEKSVKKHLSKKELKQAVKNERRHKEIFERLLFIKFLYEGDSVPKAAEELERTKATGYRWLERWNKNGIEGLKTEKRSGRPPKLSEKEREQLEEKLEEQDRWTTKEVRLLIEEEFNTKYSERHVSTLLRDLGMKLNKPYVKDERRPENAEEQLKKG